MSKTHFRKVFKSDHLGSADLEEMMEEGKSLIFTISHVNAEFNVSVAGRKGNWNVAYFNEKIKPMVLNARNSLKLKKRTNSKWVDDWKNIPVELYVDMSVTNPSTGEKGGVAIKDEPPRILNQKEIEIIKAKITASVTLDELTQIYNSDIGIKTSKELVTALGNRRKELSV